MAGHSDTAAAGTHIVGLADIQLGRCRLLFAYMSGKDGFVAGVMELEEWAWEGVWC